MLVKIHSQLHSTIFCHREVSNNGIRGDDKSLNINEAGVLHSRDFPEHNTNIRQAVTGITQRNKSGGA